MARYYEQATLIEYLNKNVATLEDGFTTMDCVTLAILYTPTADVEEVKHGKWIGVVDYGNGNCIGYCSVCGTTRNAESATHLKAFNKRCGWCGAKMDGGVSENSN